MFTFLSTPIKLFEMTVLLRGKQEGSSSFAVATVDKLVRINALFHTSSQ
ncbi:MAG: hypothetical protein ACI8Q1_003299, partial [Parvicella sp.]